MRFLIAAIRVSYAKRRPVEGSEGGRLSRLVLGCRRCALLHPVRGLAAGRSARGRDGPGARRALRVARRAPPAPRPRAPPPGARAPPPPAPAPRRRGPAPRRAGRPARGPCRPPRPRAAPRARPLVGGRRRGGGVVGGLLL